MKYIVGIDLGGTKIAGVLTDKNGRILAEKTIPTEADKGPKHVIGNIVMLASELKKKAERGTWSVGVGVPGPIIYEKGIVVNPPNLPGWKKVNLKQILEKKLKTKVKIDNDAKCAALAELKFGAGVGYKDFIYVTLSTGIGGGIIIDGKIYRGANGAAGEVGHIPVDKNGPVCGCGMPGDLEAVGSGRAFKPDPITVANAAKKGESWAQEEIDRVSQNIGLGFAGLVNILNPELIIVGGGLSNMGDLLLKPIRKYVAQFALPLPASTVKIVKAKLGTKAGVIGAAALCI